MPHSNSTPRNLFKRAGVSMFIAAAVFMGPMAIAGSHALVRIAYADPVATSPVTNTTQTDTSGTSNGTIQNPLKAATLPDLLALVLKAVVQLGVIALTLAIIWVGFMFVMARGNSEAISKARSALIWTIIGGLILLGAQAIGLVIQSTVNTL